jgi:D-glucuronyl C5-epimerase C-terminus
LLSRPHGAFSAYRLSGYQPKPVPPGQLEASGNYVPSLNAPRSHPVDANGVVRWRYEGRWEYHPLVIARYGLDVLNGYRITQNPAYLDRARVNAKFLVDTAVPREGALYFPYRFNYPLFGDKSDLIRAPWYSAMAQGAALTLFVRLHAVTGEQRWRMAADSTFATFLQPPRTRRPWTVFVARRYEHRYLWFEEYAKNPPTQVLNGHIQALFGVYEYARATGSAAAMRVFDGGATTARYQVPRFRVPGEISYYSLRVRVQYDDYHCVHVGQLKLLARMTGDFWFARAARRFAADAPRISRSC